MIFKKRKTTDEQTKEVLDIIKSNVPYGSRVWGGYKEESDYDYVINDKTYKELSKLCSKYDIKYNTRVDSRYESLPLAIEKQITITINGNKYQCSVPTDRSYDKFISAVRAMTDYTNGNPIKARSARIQTFETFVRLVASPEQYHRVNQQYNFINDNYPEFFI